MQIIKSKKNSTLRDHDPSKFFKSHEKVIEALFQSLKENDADAFLEIINIYLYINRKKLLMDES
jgi:hypothetical protein